MAYDGALTASGCTFSGNTSDGNGSGGAIVGLGATVALTNCTFFNNTATKGGALAFAADNYGVKAAATIASCSVFGNSAASGGGVDNMHGATLALSPSYRPATNAPATRCS